MTTRNVTRASFSLERLYPAAPASVFEAFARIEQKCQWFSLGPGNTHTCDFRVGGRETSTGTMPNGADMHYDAHYLDIVENQRIIYAYEMRFGPQRISATLTTIEFAAESSGTRLRFTEQGAYLDGFDGPKFSESGTSSLLGKLGSFIEGRQ